MVLHAGGRLAERRLLGVVGGVGLREPAGHGGESSAAQWPAHSSLVPASDRPTLRLPRASAVHVHAREPRRAGRGARARAEPSEDLRAVPAAIGRSTPAGNRPTSGAAPAASRRHRRCATTTGARRGGSAWRRPGQTLLYDAGGTLIFSGGITGSRGHAGDNAGEAALVALLTQRPGRSDARPACSAVRCSSPATDSEPGVIMMAALQHAVEHAAPASRRADELFAQYQHEIHKRTDRLFAGLMGFQWIAGIVFALWVSPLAWYGHDQPHAPARLGRDPPRRRDQPLPGAARAASPGRGVDALHDRRRADADGRAAHPPHRRPHRDALPRLRLAGVPGVLSRLARPRPRHRSSSRSITCCAASSGRNRSTACWSPASGAGSSTRRGSSSKTSSSSSRAAAASRR